jgi:hypothetical protein
MSGCSISVENTPIQINPMIKNIKLIEKGLYRLKVVKTTNNRVISRAISNVDNARVFFSENTRIPKRKFSANMIIIIS